MKQITSSDIKQYVKNNPGIEIGEMSESLAQMVNYFIKHSYVTCGGVENDN